MTVALWHGTFDDSGVLVVALGLRRKFSTERIFEVSLLTMPVSSGICLRVDTDTAAAQPNVGVLFFSSERHFLEGASVRLGFGARSGGFRALGISRRSSWLAWEL